MKDFQTVQFKAISSGLDPDEPLDFVLSDESVDRDGDIVRQDGLDLTQFRKNPVALFAHNHNDPIGAWQNVRRDGKRTIGRLRLAAEGTSETVDKARKLVEQGILRAVSIGFMPLEGKPLNPDEPWKGITFSRISFFFLAAFSCGVRVFEGSSRVAGERNQLY